MADRGAQAARLADGRLHLHHGPIDLLVEAFGESAEVESAYAQAQAAFAGLLAVLVEELAQLRLAITDHRPRFAGPVAQRMAQAVWPHRRRFITPMAAVAGAVADHVLACMTAGRELRRAYVNDGGDIAFQLRQGEAFRTGLITRLDKPRIDGVCRVSAKMPVRGIATSGRSGRSLSLGIADAVTVLAHNAAAADAAATLIANAVNVEHQAIRRMPAKSLDDDSDLGERLVTVAVGILDDTTVARALSAGLETARSMRTAGLIYGAVLVLQGRICSTHCDAESPFSYPRLHSAHRPQHHRL